MSKVKIQGNATGTANFIIAAPATNTDRTLTLPDVDATVMTTAGGTITANLQISKTSPQLNFSETGLSDSYIKYENNSGLGKMTIGMDSAGGSIAFRSYNGGYADRFVMDNAGRITAPYQVGFFTRGCSTTDFNAGTGSTNVIKGGTVQFNTGSGYNSTNGRFTAPVSGRYMLTAAILINSGTGRLEAALAINDTNIITMNGTGTTYDAPVLSAIVYLTAGDYTTIKRISGTAYGSHSNQYMCGYLLG